jgi:DNA-binding beta-propeller fold protein YncE
VSFEVPDPHDSNDSSVVSFRFKSDGSLLFVLDSDSKSGNFRFAITQFTLATPWDISTATNETTVLTENLSTTKQITGFDFSSDGTKLFLLNESDQEIWQYNLSTAWDVTTATQITGNTFDFSSIGSNLEESFTFSQNGLRAYIVSVSGTRIYQLNLTAAFDGSTFSDASKTLDVSAKLSSPQGVAISADGKRIFVTGQQDLVVEEYTLSTAYELDSASHTASYTASHVTRSIHEIVLKPDNTKFYLVDRALSGATAIYQHTPVTKLFPVSEYTGLKTAHGLLGYANTGQITLTQTEPLAMTVLGLEYKLSTGS